MGFLHIRACHLQSNTILLLLSDFGAFYFFLLSVLARACSRSGESGQPCLVSNLRGNAFNVSLLSMMLAVDLSCVAFIML